MSFFYDLNKKLNSIGNEQEQIAKEVAKAANKSPVRKSLEESLRSDMKALMEDGTGGMNFSGSGSLEEKAGYSAKKAAAGKDIGKPGKNFAKIAKKSGGGEKGQKIAGAVLNKLRHAKESVEEASMEESALQAYLGDKKYGKEGMKALQQAGRDHAGKEKMAKIRAQYDKMDESDMEEGNEFTDQLRKTPKGGKFKMGNKEYTDTSDLEEGMCPSCHATPCCCDESIGHDIADKKAKMSQARGEKPSALKNVAKGLKAFIQGKPEPMDETDHSEEDIMDYLNRKLAPHDKQQQAKEDAVSKPFNGPADAADAYNGMWGTGMDKDLDEDQMTLESVSRKHFQQVADLLKNIPDEAKRKEMAMHHASIFKQQNPRFDMRRFAAAAGVDLEECAMWEELKGGQVKLDKNHNGKLDANDFAMLRKGAEETDEGWDDAMALGKAAANQKPQFSRHDVKDTGYSKVYTRKPETFDEPEGEEPSADTPKRGRGRPATGIAPNRKTKGAYKHKVDEEGEEIVDEKAEQGKRHFFDKLAPAAKKVAKVVGKVVGKEDDKAEKAGKKVAKDIEYDEGDKAKDDNKAEKAGKKVTKDIEYDDKKDRKEKKTEDSKPDYIDLDKDGNKKETMKKAAKDKEEKVDETTTSGSVATATTSGKSSKGGINYGGSIYDSWNRQFETLLAESVNVTQEAAKMEDGNEEESITINVSGDDVARFKEVLASMGLGQQATPQVDVAYDDSCGTCGGTPCQCDEQMANANGATMTGELDEADVTVSQNSPDYPTNQEESDDALQYSGGLNGPKSTGQTTIPVVASQEERLHTMEESEDVDSFLNLYQSFKTK